MRTIIVAVGHNGAIGRGGDLAFHISADLKRFKALTTGHTVVMGRRTFESLPKGALPDRRNIVVTRNAEFAAPGIETANSLEKALELAAGDEIFIIGGGEIYRQSMPLADRMEITEIDAECADADTFFPVIDSTEWIAAESTLPPFVTDSKTGLHYRFCTYNRIH